MNKSNIINPVSDYLKKRSHIIIFLLSVIYALPICLGLLLMQYVTSHALFYVLSVYFIFFLGRHLFNYVSIEYKQTISYVMFYSLGLLTGILLSLSSIVTVFAYLFVFLSMLPIISLYLIHKFKPELLQTRMSYN